MDKKDQVISAQTLTILVQAGLIVLINVVVYGGGLYLAAHFIIKYF